MRRSTSSWGIRGRVIISAVALTGLLGACSSAVSGDGDASGSVTAAVPIDVSTLDPSAQYSANATGLYSNIFDALTTIAPDGELLPGLATKWTSSDGAKTWNFTLRADVKFSNGDPVTAKDVVFTFENILNSKDSPLLGPLKTLQSVKAVSDTEIEFVHKTPRANFPRTLNLIFVIPEAVYSADKAAFARKPIGSGPYVVKSWKPDDRMVLEANPQYWGKQPEVKKGVFQIVPSTASAVSALRSGDVDIVPSLPPEQVDSLSKDKSIKVEKYQTNRVVYFGINVDTPALKDVKLRQAIDAAIDREALIKLVHGAGEPVGQIVAPATFGFDESIKPTAFDLAKAKSLVADSSYEGQTIQFDFPSDRFASVGDVVQLIGSQLKAAGIKVKLNPMPYTSFLPKWFDARKKLPGLYLSTYGPSELDAGTPIQEFFTNPTRTGWSSDAADISAAKQLSVTDDAQRKAAISHVFEVAAKDVPYVYLYIQAENGGSSPDIKWTPRADTQLRFAEIKTR